MKGKNKKSTICFAWAKTKWWRKRPLHWRYKSTNKNLKWSLPVNLIVFTHFARNLFYWLMQNCFVQTVYQIFCKSNFWLSQVKLVFISSKKYQKLISNWFSFLQKSTFSSWGAIWRNANKKIIMPLLQTCRATLRQRSRRKAQKQLFSHAVVKLGRECFNGRQ